MHAVTAKSAITLPLRFDYLMDLQADNYVRLARLFGAHRLGIGHYRSDLPDGPVLSLVVTARQPYTTDLRLAYEDPCPDNATLVAGAALRLYVDAELAEARQCGPGPVSWQPVASSLDDDSAIRHRLRMASFLGRWLEYLADQGHSLSTLQRS